MDYLGRGREDYQPQLLSWFNSIDDSVKRNRFVLGVVVCCQLGVDGYQEVGSLDLHAVTREIDEGDISLSCSEGELAQRPFESEVAQIRPVDHLEA